jgi:hypothetical protein
MTVVISAIRNNGRVIRISVFCIIVYCLNQIIMYSYGGVFCKLLCVE